MEIAIELNKCLFSRVFIGVECTFAFFAVISLLLQGWSTRRSFFNNRWVNIIVVLVKTMNWLMNTTNIYHHNVIDVFLYLSHLSFWCNLIFILQINILASKWVFYWLKFKWKLKLRLFQLSVNILFVYFFIYSEKLLLGLKFGFNIHKSSTLTFSCFTISLFTS